MSDDDEETVFKLAMEQIYCSGSRRPNFKSLSSFHNSSEHEDDDILGGSHTSCSTMPHNFEEELHSNASSGLDDDGWTGHFCERDEAPSRNQEGTTITFESTENRSVSSWNIDISSDEATLSRAFGMEPTIPYPESWPASQFSGNTYLNGSTDGLDFDDDMIRDSNECHSLSTGGFTSDRAVEQPIEFIRASSGAGSDHGTFDIKRVSFSSLLVPVKVGFLSSPRVSTEAQTSLQEADDDNNGKCTTPYTTIGSPGELRDLQFTTEHSYVSFTTSKTQGDFVFQEMDFDQ